MEQGNRIIHPNGCKPLCWSPIFVGAFMAIGLSFLLNLFSVAISLTAFTTNHEGVETLAVGGLFATGVGIIAAMFASGWVTGYLSQGYCEQKHIGALYGFMTWCVSLIITVLIVTNVQSYLSFYGHFLSGTSNVVVSNVQPAGEMAAAASTPTGNIVISAYIIFALFFLSAFASSLGGHCGLNHKCKTMC